MFLKLSILFLYIRTFTESRIFRRLVQALMIVIVVSHVGFVFILRFRYTTLDCNWVISETEGIFDAKCPTNYDVIVLYVFLALISSLTVVLDLIIMALPCPAAWRLHLPRRQKLAILITLISGAV